MRETEINLNSLYDACEILSSIAHNLDTHRLSGRCNTFDLQVWKLREATGYIISAHEMIKDLLDE